MRKYPQINRNISTLTGKAPLVQLGFI